MTVSPVVRAASAHIALSPNFGPPTSLVRVKGKNFGVSELVSITFDTSLIATYSTNAHGAFSLKVSVPASANPGNHTIQATGQSSDLSAQAIFLVQTNWAMFGFGPEHRGLNPYENVLTPANVPNLTQDWAYTTNSYIRSSPVVVNGVVYIGSDDYHLYALNASTGTLLWSYTTGGPLNFMSSAVANGVVYVGSYDNQLYALNATTGAVLWSYTTGGRILSGPAVANGVVYVGSEDNKFYAFHLPGTTP